MRVLTILAFAVICFLQSAKTIYAQSSRQDPQFESPNAAAFNVSNKYPQIGSTGTPDIQVPVYNLSSQGLSLPIALSYNTNGVKPNTYASWVGLGWNLSVGGAIVRKINDKADDMNYMHNDVAAYTNDHEQGYFYNRGYLSDPNWTSTSRIQGAVRDNNQGNYTYNRSHFPYGGTVKDYSPDEFNFSVGNIFGSFYMDHEGKWKVRSDSKVTVIPFENDDFIWTPQPSYQRFPDAPGQPHYQVFTMPDKRYLYRITLLDAEGIRYVFGGTPNSYERAYYGTKTWYLSEVIFPNGKSMKFNYFTGNNVQLFQLEEIWVNTYNYVTQNTYVRYPSSIETDDVTISFITSSEGAGKLAKLDAILVKDKLNLGTVQNYVFSYFDTPMDRLKLKSLQQLDLHGNEISKYTFSYNSTSFSGIVKPYQYSPPLYKTDHWGYFSAIPYNTTGAAAFYQSRDADVSNCRAELLDKVFYPTGGYTQYIWQPHDFSKEVSSNRSSVIDDGYNRYAGGVRIKQIDHFDKNDLRVGFKRYSYVRNFNPNTEVSSLSSGVLSYQPKEVFYDQYSFRFFPLVPTSSVEQSGAHIRYSEVTEIESDGGYTNTIYSNFDNGVNGEYMDEQPLGLAHGNWTGGAQNFYHEYSLNEHERGKPLIQTTYTSTSQPITQKTIDYTRINKANEYVRIYKTHTDPNWFAVDLTYMPYYGIAYKIYTNAYLPSTVTEKTFIDYDILKPVTKTTSYFYNPSTLMVTSVTTTNSKGEMIVTEKRYPSDMVPNNDPTGVYGHMLAQHHLSPVVESTVKNGSTIMSVQHVDFGEPYPNLFKKSLETIKYGTGPTKNVFQYNAFDDAGNVLSFNKEAGAKGSFIYGYNKTLPIAQITNAGNTECYFEGFEDFGSYGHARTGNRYYEGPFQCSFAIPNARAYKLSYWYRTSGSAVWIYVIEDYTGPKTIRFGTTDDIDDVRILPGDAQMTTYTYELGQISSVTDPRNRSTYYEFDDVGRLRLVKDHEKNIVKSICYNYAGQSTGCALSAIYSSTAQTGNFKSLICPSGNISSSVSYSVPAGKYVSYISQEYANQKARTELQINGQIKANKTSQCAPGEIYARVEVKNLRPVSYDPSYTMGDVLIKFYGDPGCFSPIQLPFDTDIIINMVYRDLEYGGDQIYDTMIYDADAGESQVEMGTYTLFHSNQFLYIFSVLEDPLGVYTFRPTNGDDYLYW